MIGILVATALLIAVPLVIRLMGRRGIYFLIVPANSFALIVTDDEKTGEASKGGGNIVDLLHSIPGMQLVKPTQNPMDWYFAKGEETRNRGFLYQLLGVQVMGFFRYARTVKDERLRFTKNEDKYEVKSKKKIGPFVFFSGELDIKVEEADTADGFELNFDFNSIFERTFPVRSILRVADEYAMLVSLAEEVANNMSTTLPAEAFIGAGTKETNQQTDDNKRKLAADVKGLSAGIVNGKVKPDSTEDKVGMTFTSVNLRSVDMTEESRRLLQLKVEAEKQAEAEIERERRNVVVEIQKARQEVVKATGEKRAQMLRNDADADRIERVIKPAAQDDRTVAVVQAEAYRDNEHVIAVGGTPLINLPVGK